MTMKFSALALAAAMALPTVAGAAEPAQQPRVVVTGEGEASVAPDMAVLTLAVMREAATAREALEANNNAMAAVISAMKSAGIEERDLQTAGVQIMPRYDYTNRPDGTQESKLAAYQVTNTLSVRVRDIAKTGEILDKSVSLGVNQGGGISFTNDNPSTVVTEARKKAIADAIAKARTLTEAAGVELGRIVEISEGSYAQPPMPFMAKAMRAEDAGSVPIQAGENAYKVLVNVTFELK